MKSLGEILRGLRIEKGEPLRKVAGYLDVDQAILSKIERGKRQATKVQIEKFAKYFAIDQDELLIGWLSEKVILEVKGEEIAEEALKIANEQIRKLNTPKITLARIKRILKKRLEKFPAVKKVWLFGSFARNQGTHNSDIDLMIDVPGKKHFSLFDMLEVQNDLEEKFKRKVDIVMKGAVKPFAWETAKKDLKLIYDRK